MLARADSNFNGRALFVLKACTSALCPTWATHTSRSTDQQFVLFGGSWSGSFPGECMVQLKVRVGSKGTAVLLGRHAGAPLFCEAQREDKR
jgi:hypothetical protein